MSAKETTKKSTKAPTSMEELLASEEFQLKPVKRGQVIEGTIVSITPIEVLVDIGGKSEGVISGRELGGEELKVGDKILALVMQSEDESGRTVLSIKRAGGERRWRELEDLYNSGAQIESRGIETNRGGLVVDLGGVRGFIPSSQLSSEFSGNAGIGKTLQGKIIEFDRKGNRLILSQRALTAEASRRKFEEAAAKFKSGETLTGKVSGVMPYGLFVSLSEGIEGLVHISEVSWDRVTNLVDLFKMGDEVKVKVLSVDPSAGRINLSIKALTQDPWREKMDQLKVGAKTSGEVIKVNQFGVFVALPQGIDGLVRTAKIPEYMIDIKPGDKLDLIIEDVKPEQRRVSLAIAESETIELKPIEEIVESEFEKKEKKSTKKE